MTARSLLFASSTPLSLAAQQAPSPVVPPPILTSASVTAAVRLDRAALSFTVGSRAPTAAKAGAETARRQSAVVDTLRALGVSAEQIVPASIEIDPKMALSTQNKVPAIANYVARNSVRVEI